VWLFYHTFAAETKGVAERCIESATLFGICVGLLQLELVSGSIIPGRP
jgi:hypothetical protein